MTETVGMIEDPNLWVQMPSSVFGMRLPLMTDTLRDWLDENTPGWHIGWARWQRVLRYHGGPATTVMFSLPAFRFTCLEHTVLFRLGWTTDDLRLHVWSGR